MKFITKERFNGIDMAVAMLAGGMIVAGHSLSAFAVLVVGGIISGFIQAAFA